MQVRRGAVAWIVVAVLAGVGCSDESGGGGVMGGGVNAVAVSPPADVTNVPITAQIRVTFDQNIDPATLTSASFFIEGPAGAVLAAIDYDMASMTATLTPNVNLAGVTTHTVNVTSAVRTPSGDALTPLTFSFLTGTGVDNTPPSFLGAATAQSLGTDSISVAWLPGATDNFDPSASISFRVFRSDTSGGQDFNQPVGVTAPAAISFVDTGLESATTYYYVVRAVDTSGNESATSIEVNATTD